MMIQASANWQKWSATGWLREDGFKVNNVARQKLWDYSTEQPLKLGASADVSHSFHEFLALYTTLGINTYSSFKQIASEVGTTSETSHCTLFPTPP